MFLCFRLSKEAKAYMSKNLGSSFLSEVKFRDLWYIATMPAQNRFTLYEKVSIGLL